MNEEYNAGLSNNVYMPIPRGEFGSKYETIILSDRVDDAETQSNSDEEGFSEETDLDSGIEVENDSELRIKVENDDPQNLTNESSRAHGFIVCENRGEIIVEEEDGTKTYKMQLYTPDSGNDKENYTCLGMVEMNEIYVNFSQFLMRVDKNYENIQPELYKVDQGLPVHTGYAALSYYNQYYQEITPSPFLVDLPPFLKQIPGVLVNNLNQGELQDKARRSRRAQKSPQTDEEFFAKFRRDQAREEELRLAVYQKAGPGLSAKQVALQVKKAMKGERENEEAKKLDAQSMDRFIKNQRLKYQSRLKNSGRASAYSAMARYRTRLPPDFDAVNKLQLYVVVKNELVPFFGGEAAMQKWLDDFLQNTNQQKFKLVHATIVDPAITDLNAIISLKVGEQIEEGLRYYSCHPAQFYKLYVKADFYHQLRGAPMKQKDGTLTYQASWELSQNYEEIAKLMTLPNKMKKNEPKGKKGLKKLTEELDKIDSKNLIQRNYPDSKGPGAKMWAPWIDSGWVLEGNGDTLTCVSSVKYGMARKAKRKKQQGAVMGCSATDVAEVVWDGVDTKNRGSWRNTAEWLHRSGFRMGGLGPTVEKKPTQTSQSARNLVFGSKEANTAMLRYEDAAARMVDYWEQARYEAQFPPDQEFETFVKKSKDEWYRIRLKPYTFKQWIDAKVRDAKARQDDALPNPEHLRPLIDQRLRQFLDNLEKEESFNPLLDHAQLKKEREEALKNTAWHSNGDMKFNPINSYALEHGHLSTSTLTARNIPMILVLYNYIRKLNILTNPTAEWCKQSKKAKDITIDNFTKLGLAPETKGVHILSEEVPHKLDQDYQNRWNQLELFERNRAVALTRWISRSLQWKFVINFPSMRTADGTVLFEKPVAMCTEFDLHSRYTPLLIEAQLDREFDVTLWDQGYFEIEQPPRSSQPSRKITDMIVLTSLPAKGGTETEEGRTRTEEGRIETEEGETRTEEGGIETEECGMAIES